MGSMAETWTNTLPNGSRNATLPKVRIINNGDESPLSFPDFAHECSVISPDSLEILYDLA